MALMVYYVLVLVQLVSAIIRNDEKVKRILVNDPDVVHQVMLLKQEMEVLKNKLSASEMKSQNMEKEIIQLNSSLRASEMHSRNMEKEILRLNSGLSASEMKSQYMQTDIIRLNNSLSASEMNGMLMKQDIDQLNSSFIASVTDSQFMKKEILQLSSSLTELTTKTQKRSGAVYIRWGRTTCSGSGYMAGQHYGESSHKGGPSNYLCLPRDPELTNKSMSSVSHLYGTEYQQNILRSDAADEDAPCAVCQSSNRTSSVMIPGRKTCYSGWMEEYNGYLASDDFGYSASSFLCLDKDIEYVPGGVENKNGRLLYMTTTKCGSLSCPPYKDDQLVFCVVCSK